MAGNSKKREATLLQVKEEIGETMRRMLELLDKPASAAAKAVTRNEVLAVSDQVSKEATKVAALWTSDPKLQDGLRVLRVLENTVVAFLGMSNASSVGMGPTLLASLRTVASVIVESCITLVDGVIAYGLHGGKKSEAEAAAIPPLAGRVWEACDAMKRLPPDNRTAVGRALTRLATSVKDVMREIKEMELEEEEEEEEEKEKEKKDEKEKDDEHRHLTTSVKDVIREIKEMELDKEEGEVKEEKKKKKDKQEEEKEKDDEDDDTPKASGIEEADEDDFNFDPKLSVKEMEVAKRVDRLCECVLGVFKQLLFLTIELKEPTLDGSSTSPSHSSSSSSPTTAPPTLSPAATAGSALAGPTVTSSASLSAPLAPSSFPPMPTGGSTVAGSTGNPNASLAAPSGVLPSASLGLAAGGLPQLPSLGSGSSRRGKHGHGRGRPNGGSSGSSVNSSSSTSQNVQPVQWTIVRPPEGFTSINILEKLLKLSKGISSEIEEIGAGLYPPQEISAIRERSQKIKALSEQIPELLKGVIEPVPEKLRDGLGSLRETIQWLDQELAKG